MLRGVGSSGAAGLTPGSIAGWLTLLTLVIVGVIVWRGGGGQAIDILQKANHVLRDELSNVRGELNEALGQVAAANAKIAALEKERSLEPIIEAVATLFVKHERQVASMMAAQEGRAQDRHDAHLKVLDLIAHRLGPEPTNGEHP